MKILNAAWKLEDVIRVNTKLGVESGMTRKEGERTSSLLSKGLCVAR